MFRRLLARVEERPTFLVRNQMPSRLEIRGSRHTLKLAPLQQVRIHCRPDKYLGKAAEHAFVDRAVSWEREPVRSTRVWATAWLTLVCAVAVVVAVAILLLDPTRWWLAAVAFAIAVGCILAAAPLNRALEEPPDDPLLGGELGQRLSGWRFTRDVAVTALQKLALITVLAVGVLGPAAAIYYGSELSGVLSVLDFELTADEGSYPIIVARGLQIVLVITLSIVPGLMYFQFDREKLTTLMDRWVHHAFRLNPTLHTLSDVDAAYGRRVEEFYGASFDSGVTTVKKRATTRSPLYVATLLLVLGWIVVLLNAPADLAVRAGELVRDGAPAQPLPSIQQFIQPAFTPMTCAFLGAYFFTVQVVLLGYVRGDLRPKTYNVVSVRILVAVILAWMLQALFGSALWVLAACFLAGIVPDTVLRFIRDVPVRARLWFAQWRRTADTSEMESMGEFDERSPLVALDGIGIYERTRLAEEGITSIQALARHDLVDLMLSSRIPASRLIDWVDQALLYQHVTAEDRRRLRATGIRTASELFAANRNAHVRDHLIEQLDTGDRRLPVILQALRGDEWLTYVTHWRSHDDTREPSRTIYTDDGLMSPLVTRLANGAGARLDTVAQAGLSDIEATLPPGPDDADHDFMADQN